MAAPSSTVYSYTQRKGSYLWLFEPVHMARDPLPMHPIEIMLLRNPLLDAMR